MTTVLDCNQNLWHIITNQMVNMQSFLGLECDFIISIRNFSDLLISDFLLTLVFSFLIL